MYVIEKALKKVYLQFLDFDIFFIYQLCGKHNRFSTKQHNLGLF